jgi:nucleoside-diphosphate-sugar epimerase
MKTILFGGSGFLGPVILEKYPEIVSVGRNSPPSYVKNRHIQLDSLDDLSILDGEEIDNVIFLIGSSNHHFLNSQVVSGIDYNVYPLKKTLSYFSKRKINKFICFTTILLYDSSLSTKSVSEDHPTNPYLNEYIFSKYLSEEIVEFYSDKVPSIIIRCSNIYGPTKLVRPDLIPTLIQNVINQDEVSVWSKKPQRDFIFLEDAADALMGLLETPYIGKVNLGTGETTSVGRICETLERLSNKQILDLDVEVSGPMHFCCDISLIKSLTGWTPKYTIEQGLEKTYLRMKDWATDINYNI